MALEGVEKVTTVSVFAPGRKSLRIRGAKDGIKVIEEVETSIEVGACSKEDRSSNRQSGCKELEQ